MDFKKRKRGFRRDVEEEEEEEDERPKVSDQHNRDQRVSLVFFRASEAWWFCPARPPRPGTATTGRSAWYSARRRPARPVRQITPNTPPCWPTWTSLPALASPPQSTRTNSHNPHQWTNINHLKLNLNLHLFLHLNLELNLNLDLNLFLELTPNMKVIQRTLQNPVVPVRTRVVPATTSWLKIKRRQMGLEPRLPLSTTTAGQCRMWSSPASQRTSPRHHTAPPRQSTPYHHQDQPSASSSAREETRSLDKRHQSLTELWQAGRQAGKVAAQLEKYWRPDLVHHPPSHHSYDRSKTVK